MPRSIALLLTLTLIFAADSISKPDAAGQQAPPASDGYRFKVSVNSVLLNVSVRERATNRGIPNLRKEDFVVYEDGVPQRVDQLLQSDAPFSSLLLIDNSGSTRAYLPLMKAAAVDFVRQLKANDRVAVANFNSLVELGQDFTDDRALAVRAIQNISSIGGTALYDALMTCIDIYMRGIDQRSAIVVFTDGVDNQLEGQNTEGSRTLFSELFRRVQEIDPIIYAIFLNSEPQRRTAGPGGMPPVGPGGWPFPWPRRDPAPGPARPPKREIDVKARDQLFTIADQTGGRMYTLTRPEDLTRTYREIAEDLRIQYLLAYTPNNHGRDNMWHDIRIVLKNHPEASVRTRKGYYAQKTPDALR
jgi:VWFA-related protein